MLEIQMEQANMLSQSNTSQSNLYKEKVWDNCGILPKDSSLCYCKGLYEVTMKQ